MRESKELKSMALKAGKRTYFFDLKETRNMEHYLVIAESKKKFDEEEGHFFYEKHKIFLPIRDLERFASHFDEMLQFAKEHFSEEEFQNKFHGEDSSFIKEDNSGEFEDL